jgi:CheY-like chemotaxis protein
MKAYQLVVQIYLRDTPYTVDLAENSMEVAERFASRSYNLVIIDIDMLFMDSDTIVQGIREFESHQRLKPIPIIAMTNHTFRMGFDCGAHLKFTTHLTKPLRKLPLLTAIQDLIN